MTATLTNVVDGKGMPSIRPMEFVDPATGSLLGEPLLCGAPDFDAAMAAADRATAWRRTTRTQRQKAMLALADLLDEHAEERRGAMMQPIDLR